MRKSLEFRRIATVITFATERITRNDQSDYGVGIGIPLLGRDCELHCPNFRETDVE